MHVRFTNWNMVIYYDQVVTCHEIKTLSVPVFLKCLPPDRRRRSHNEYRWSQALHVYARRNAMGDVDVEKLRGAAHLAATLRV